MAIETSVILTVSREEAAPDVFVCVTFGSDAVAHHIGGEDGITARRCDAAVLESVARSYPEAEFLLLVEHPARALARDGNSEWCASPVALLNAWNDSAARMLRHLRTCRTRTIVLSLDELEALGVHRDEYLARIRAWLPIVLPARPGVIGPSHHEDALVSLLARRVVREDSNAEDLHAELVMACEPVPPDWSMPGPIQRQHDTIDAAALLASWSQSVAKVEQLRSESEALRRELRAAQERLKAEHQTSMERQAAASSASQKVIGRYKAELAAVLAQLHQTQEELERQFLTQQAAATARATELAQLQRELGEAASVAERAQEELERQFLTQQAAATARATELAQLQRELSEAASVAERARRERRTLEAEALGHLLQVKAIDDNAAARLLRLDDDAAAARVGRIVIGTAHDGAEHRHLEFELRDARGLRGPLARLRLRLLEHRGHAGLALLCGVGEIEPIGAWETHGQEGDDRFCLLLPGDQASRGVWQRLSAADWRFLLTIVVQLDGQLSQSTLPLAPFWRGIARRLRMLLWQMPPRLRYDGVEVFGDVAAEGRTAVRIEFRGALFGWRELGTVVLCWRPGASFHDDPVHSAVSLAYLGTVENPSPPLSVWPVAPDGTWAPWMSLPVGPRMPGAVRRARWAQLPAVDRLFVLALLDAMPAARADLASAHTTVPPQTATVAEVARQLHKQGRRTLLGLELRRVLRGLLRR